MGETPPQFQGGLASYSIAEILRMIVFYNDDFGIVLNDSLAMQIDKFRSYDCHISRNFNLIEIYAFFV